MTTQYVYTQEEHQEAVKNAMAVKQLKIMLDRGGVVVLGKLVKDINEFILACLNSYEQ